MDEIRGAGLTEVSASSRRLPAPPVPPRPAAADISVLQANLDDARKATWRGDLGVAQDEVERVLQGLSARKQGGAKEGQDVQALEGSAESLLGQILTEREGLGARAREALERAADVLRLVAGKEPKNAQKAQTYADYGAALHLLGQRQEAEHALQQAVDLGDMSPPTARRLASLLLEGNRAQQAKEVLLPVSTAVPGDVEILSLLGRAERVLGETDAALSHLTEAAAAAVKTGKLARALDLYEAAAELSPDSELNLARGEVLRALGRMEDAIAAYDLALADAPGLLQAKVGKADALRVLGDFSGALGLLQDVLRTDPRHAFALAIMGDVLRNLGRHGDALTALNTSLDEDPASAWAAGTRGQVLRALGRHAEAQSDLERATGAVPELAWAWAELAATHYELGNNDQAQYASQQALCLDPNIPLALAVSARCLVDAGDFRKALDSLQALLDVEPVPEWAWASLAGALRETGDDRAARAIVERAIEAGNGGAEPFLLRAELRLAAGNEGEKAAAEDLNVYLRSEPTDSSSLLRAGRAYRAAGDPEHAAEVLELALAVADAPEIHCEKAAAEFELGHYDKVLAALEAVVSPPAVPEDLWRRGVAAWRLGDITLANRSFKQALEQQADYLPALRGLVYLNLERQKLDRAQEYASIALREHADDSGALSAVAQVEIVSLDYEKAFGYLDRALQADPDNWSAQFMYGRSLVDTGRFRRAVDVFEHLQAAGNTLESVFQILGFALENMAVSTLTSRAPALDEVARALLVRAQNAYQEGLRRSQDNHYLKRGRADTISLLAGSEAARAAYTELVTALEAMDDYDRDLIGLLGWCYFRLGRHDEAIRAYVSALSAETGTTGDYLRFDLALATLAADPSDHVRSEYQQARDLCEGIPVPRRRGLFQVARNDLVATLVAGGFSDPAIAHEIAAEFDQELSKLAQLDTFRPRDPFGDG